MHRRQHICQYYSGGLVGHLPLFVFPRCQTQTTPDSRHRAQRQSPPCHRGFRGRRGSPSSGRRESTFWPFWKRSTARSRPWRGALEREKLETPTERPFQGVPYPHAGGSLWHARKTEVKLVGHPDFLPHRRRLGHPYPGSWPDRAASSDPGAAFRAHLCGRRVGAVCPFSRGLCFLSRDLHRFSSGSHKPWRRDAGLSHG